MKRWFVLAGCIVLVFVVLIYVSTSETKEEFRTCTVLGIEDVDNFDYKNYDSITVAANLLYEASFFKQVMQGKQYRDAWAEPVTVPIVFLDTLKGGLKIIEEGGGKQTHSLELEDRRGIRYTLRSLSKNPEPLVPELAKNLNLENIIIDGVSAQHAYAALVVAALAEEADILHTKPTLVFVPKQKSLGDFNEKFGNRLFFLEFESKGKVDWTGLPRVIEIVDTEKLQEYKFKEHINIELNKSAVIRARLFELIIGDWDRHAKQWGWVLQEGGDKVTATPIATDRDNAFFAQDGILPTLIANDLMFPKMQEFSKDINFLEGLVIPFDEYFLRSASPDDFRNEALQLQSYLSDTAIDNAFIKWPEKIDQLNGPEIRTNLKARRDNILEYAVKFYEIIQGRPFEKIALKGSEELKLEDKQMKCFDCAILSQ